MRRRIQFPSIASQSTFAFASLAMAITLLATQSSLAEKSFPYAAVITANEADVQSGPDKDFYATTKLKQGTNVEVYRHDANGWCAIRPPANSFSWVAAEHVELTDDPTLARVINVPVKTRVGTEFSDIHDVEYISLRKGEVLKLLGSKTLKEASGDPRMRWFKIAPPAGEFRWVHEQTLRPINAATVEAIAPKVDPVARQSIKTFDLATKTPSESNPKTIAPASFLKDLDEVAPNATDAFVELAGHTDSNDAASAPQPRTLATQPIAETTEPVGSSTLQAKSADETQTANTHVNAVTWQAVAAPTDILSAPEPRSFVDQYNALNVLLSRALLQDIKQWQFETVEQQAALLVQQADDTHQEELAHALQAKISELKELRERSIRVSSTPVASEPIVAATAPQAAQPPTVGTIAQAEFDKEPETPSLLPSFQPDAEVTGPELPVRVKKSKATSSMDVSKTKLQPAQEPDNSVFDATGVLIAVQSRRTDMPRYALADSSGQLVRFVAGEHNADLNKYVNKKVGILGEVGFLRRFNKPVVVARQVVPIQR